MNFFRNILIIGMLLGLLLIGASTSRAQAICTGNYTFTTSGLTVNFSGSTSANITNVVWDFGDGNFDNSNQLNVSHTYASPGIYTACIQYYDSTICGDSTCHPIMLSSCYGTISFNVNGMTGIFYGTANGAGPNVIYAWNFGDATTSNLQNPSHTYANTGVYTVCFAYYDTSNGCSDSVCTQVSITGSCYADFTWIDSLGYCFFINQSSTGNTGNYFWDFGDSSTGNTFNPSHTYANPGMYLVCLTAYDSMMNFCDSTCHWVTVNNVQGIHERTSSTDEINIYPNPSSGTFTAYFTLEKNSEVRFALYDLSGRQVQLLEKKEFTTGKHNEDFNTDGLPSGTYILRINSNTQTINSRIIITTKL
ncbi:MAG: PKD domain-containing protein [Bacteroidetes bacterium]|nr:PKD domain-containing protein [Bacteroidota bacterium]